MSGRLKIDLREEPNPRCKCCKGRSERDRCTNNGICEIASSSLDNGLVRCVGDWGQEKVYYLLQYLGIFANGMHKRWPGLNYIEICSGPGRSINYRTWKEHDGSALAVLRHQTYKHISNALFLDHDARIVDQLKTRIKVLDVLNAKASPVDYRNTDHLRVALDALPKGRLNLVFVDPTDLSFPFSALQAIAQVLPKADLIMTVAIGMDFNRNADKAVMLKDSAVREKYEAFLGLAGFFETVHSKDGRGADVMTINELRAEFTKAFREQLASIGYAFTDAKSIRHYYDLVFASGSSKGLDFWRKACMIEHDGKRRLPLGED
jgi:three-Cys-motif partner protein